MEMPERKRSAVRAEREIAKLGGISGRWSRRADIWDVSLETHDIQVLILGSARGVRRLDPTQSYPHALARLPRFETEGSGDEALPSSVLEWNVRAFADAGVRDVRFVGGYHIQKVVERFPSLTFEFHAEWEQEGVIAGLLLAMRHLHRARPLLVVDGNVVLRAGALDALRTTPGEIVCGVQRATESGGVDGTWSRDAQGSLSTGRDRRLSGLVFLRSGAFDRAVGIARAAFQSDPRADVSCWVQALHDARCEVAACELDGFCSSLRVPRDLARFVLGTKAQTLERLAPMLEGCTIPASSAFTVGRWRREPDVVLRELASALPAQRLVVRSSSLLEDMFASSNAGKFHSELDVSHAELPGAIERVAASYAKGGTASSDSDQVLVQEYVCDARVNGVLFTRVPDDGAPYYVLNDDHADGATDTVTSGSSRTARTMLVGRHAPRAATQRGPAWQARIFDVAKRVESLVHHDALDIEFAVDHDECIHVLQVRPLAHDRPQACADADVAIELDEVRGMVASLLGPSAWMLGPRSVLGVMPDWNPAEVIGVCPRPLTLSLYRSVITDGVWARARARLGYRDIGPTPLMYALSGRPYIDVRASLNSFLPAQLDDAIGARMIEAGVERLIAEPSLHDKIEFELLPTCMDADAPRWRSQLGDAGLSAAEVTSTMECVALHTDGMIGVGRLDIDTWCARVATLCSARERFVDASRESGASRETGPHAFLCAKRLLDEARELGTSSFAVLARLAFVAVAMVRSLVRVGVIAQDDADHIFASVPTVASEVTSDFARLKSGSMHRDEFLVRHGHLRPGTYDILSPSYAEAPGQYLGREVQRERVVRRAASARPAVHARDVLMSKQRAVDGALRAAGLKTSAESLATFVEAAIPAREYAKHEFTKNVSIALAHLARGVERFGLTRDDASFLTIERLLQLAVESPSAAERTELHRVVGLYRKRHAITTTLRLPHLIVRPGDVDGFVIPALRPNFVTRARAMGPGRELRPGPAPHRGLDGAMVLIENADPGYDWIFSHKIAGLVTKYGGVASHMAIRAAEFRIPAAIGCGDTIFEPLRGAPMIALDCAAERVWRAA
jgi:glutamine kinase